VRGQKHTPEECKNYLTGVDKLENDVLADAGDMYTSTDTNNKAAHFFSPTSLYIIIHFKIPTDRDCYTTDAIIHRIGR